MPHPDIFQDAYTNCSYRTRVPGLVVGWRGSRWRSLPLDGSDNYTLGKDWWRQAATPLRIRSPQGSKADMKKWGQCWGQSWADPGYPTKKRRKMGARRPSTVSPKVGGPKGIWENTWSQVRKWCVLHTHTVHTLEFEFWSQARFVRILVPMNKLSDRITWGKSDWFWLLVSDHEGKMRSRTDHIIMVQKH